jgi:hypothetical protein
MTKEQFEEFYNKSVSFLNREGRTVSEFERFLAATIQAGAEMGITIQQITDVPFFGDSHYCLNYSTPTGDGFYYVGALMIPHVLFREG